MRLIVTPSILASQYKTARCKTTLKLCGRLASDSKRTVRLEMAVGGGGVRGETAVESPADTGHG